MKAIDELAQLEAQARVFVGQNNRLEACKVFINAKYSASYAQAAVNRMFDELPTYAQLQADLAAALARAQAAEGEAQRLREALEGVLMRCAKNPLDVNDTDGNRLNGVKLHTRKALGKPPFED